MRMPDGKTGLYVGQGLGVNGVTNRLTKGHMRASVQRAQLKLGALHYKIWADANFKNDSWVILGQLPTGVDDEALILNIFEMWCSLVMRSVQDHSLSNYLPKGVRTHVVEGVR